jgi:hypothetical protein
MCRLIVKEHHIPEHANRLEEGAVAVIVRVAVLLEEIFLDDFGNVKCDFIGFSESTLI